MTGLSINAAWNETTAFVRREARLVFPLAFLLLALPGTLMQAVAPQGAPGEVATEMNAASALLLVPMIVASLVGTLALAVLALRPGTAVGEALRIGLRRMFPLLGAVLIVMLAFALVLVPLILVIGVQGDAGALVLLLGMAAVIGGLFLWVRLMLVTPIAAVEDVGPIGILQRSWELTGPVFWRLLGFVLLLIVLFLVLMMVIGIVGGLLAVLLFGMPEPGSLANFVVLLVTALVQTVIALYFTVLVARIYAQLAGDNVAKVFG